MRSIKVISFISLVVLGLSTISCKDELEDVSCVDETKRIAYELELKAEFDEEFGDQEYDFEYWLSVGRWSYNSTVCGCDNKTYSNDHEAKLEGVFIFTEGDCENE